MVLRRWWIKFQFYGAAPCVRAWKDGADNGGVTAQGVTGDSVKVVVLVPPEDKDRSSTNGGIKNQATGANGLSKDALLDENAVLAHSYHTWGRTVEYEFVEATGTDETAQRADAVSVVAKKPFAVMDTATFASGGGGLVFQQAVAQAGVPANPQPLTPTEMLKPYEVNMAEWVGKQPIGGKAQFGGDAVKTKKRVFGVIYPSGSTGITSSATGTFTKEAASQDWYPEWLVSGVPYEDLDFFARAFDQTQWAHAFGQVRFTPFVAGGASDALTNLAQWYWGKTQGTHSPGVFSLVHRLYNGIQLAGPNLTAKTFCAALGWWNPKATGGSNQIGIPGTGKYEYLNRGKRYLTGKYPKKLQPFFQEAGSILQFDAIPEQDRIGPYACTGCPSTGGGQVPAAAS